MTGGAGFVGSHLVDRLVAEGRQVLVVDDLSTGEPGNLVSGVRLEQLDVATDDLGPVFKGWKPTEVFHLAAQASVPRSMANPLRDLAVNVIGTHHVATGARDAGADRVVFVSTGGGIYGETARPATERTLPAPSSYYGAHKLAAETHVMLSGVSYSIARPSNVYGPRQAPGLEGAVVASFIRQALNDGSLQVHGDGGQTRDMIHVYDVVAALWRLAQPDITVGLWNVSSGRATSVRELASVVERAAERRLGRRTGPRRAGDVNRSVISNARLRRLGWKPEVRLTDGITALLKSTVTA